jgi:uncharacterized protein
MKTIHRSPLPFNQVSIIDSFWAPRILANHTRGLDAVYRHLETTGRLAAYDLDWTPESDLPTPHVFWDSDVAKWLEGACNSLMTHPDEALRCRVDAVVTRILSAQGEDGYLNPHFSVVEPEGRWINLRDKHELYCAGHLLEAAIAYHRATGDSQFLNAIQKYIDLIGHTFGPNEGQLPGYPGHEELELALIKLYRHTNDLETLKLAKYFIDQRGQQPHYFDWEARQRNEDPADYWAKSHTYTQSHKPVREQREVVGHAVRGMYLYSAMADIAREIGDPKLVTALNALWNDLTTHKLYLTGGIGSSSSNEGYTTPYDLPNRDAYAETCAAIGLVFWAHRMLQLELDSRYADVMERALYNGVLSGVSLSGDRFFYENPLGSDGNHHRQSFFTCSCCPPNLNRLLPAIGEYIYSIDEREIDVHLYIQSDAQFEVGGEKVIISQHTAYPWDGVVCLQVEPAQPVDFTLKLRFPGWCQEGRIYLNGESVSFKENLENGYIVLNRKWRTGDEVLLQWVMPVTRIYANPQVKADRGKVALMRGPLVYCLEEIDQSVPLENLRLGRSSGFDISFDPHLLDGMITVHGWALAVDRKPWGSELYRDKPPKLREVSFTAIPYFAWDNRQPGEMLVWLPEAVRDS